MKPMDAMLAQQDFDGLAKALNNPPSAADLIADMDWERDKVIAGSSVFITFMYIRDLSLMADASRSHGEELRDTAALMELMAYAAISVDGSYCSDSSAPSRHIDELITWQPEIWAHMKQMPLAERKQLAAFVPDMEQKMSKARLTDGYDAFICSGGMQDIISGLALGGVKEVPTPPGHLGRTYEVTPPKGQPNRVSSDVATARIAEARAALPKAIAAFLGL